MIPAAERAFIDPAKVRDYLLSAVHPVGRFKAVIFQALGYTAERWEDLRDDLLALARTTEAVPGQTSIFGQKYEVSCYSAWSERPRSEVHMRVARAR